MKAVALLNLHFAATCIEYCHSKLQMTNGGLSFLNLSEVYEASASTDPAPMVSMNGMESHVLLLISFVSPFVVLGGTASISLDPQWLEVLWSQP